MDPAAGVVAPIVVVRQAGSSIEMRLRPVRAAIFEAWARERRQRDAWRQLARIFPVVRRR